MSNFAGPEGYDNHIEIHFDHLAVASSINYARFLEAESCRVASKSVSTNQCML